jgi:tetratricopeptide (TPR) repeat protein
MNKMKYITNFFIILIVFSCYSPEHKIRTIFIENKVVLDDEDIFNNSKIEDYVFHTAPNLHDSIINKSKRYFLDAIDEFKNKKSYEKAIPLFKKSIIIFPDAKSYFELGNVYLESKNYKQAVLAFKMAETLKFSPIGLVYFNIANALVADNNNYSEWQVTEYLKKSILSGYFEIELLDENPLFSNYRSSESYQEVILSYKNKLNLNQANYKFISFLKSFPEITDNKFLINKDDIFNKPSEDFRVSSINYSFSTFIPEMENSGFGRDVSNEFFYVAKIIENPNYVAVLYKSINYMANVLQPTQYYLTTYDINGKIISQKLVACLCSPIKFKLFEFNSATITIEEYKREWEKDLREVELEENYVKNDELVSKEYFTINELGIIESNSNNTITLK